MIRNQPTLNARDQDHLITDEDQDHLITDEDQDHLMTDTVGIDEDQDQGKEDIVMTTRGERGEGLALPRGEGGATGHGAEDTPSVGGAGNRFIINNTHRYMYM